MVSFSARMAQERCVSIWYFLYSLVKFDISLLQTRLILPQTNAILSAIQKAPRGVIYVEIPAQPNRLLELLGAAINTNLAETTFLRVAKRILGLGSNQGWTVSCDGLS